MTVHHNPNRITNLLSLKSVAQKHIVMYKSWDHGSVFKVHTQNGAVEFKPSKRGLHYVDVSVDETVQHMLVTTNDMSAEDDDKKEESRDFRQIEDNGLKGSEDKDFEVYKEVKDSNEEYMY